MRRTNVMTSYVCVNCGNSWYSSLKFNNCPKCSSDRVAKMALEKYNTDNNTVRAGWPDMKGS